MKIQSAIDNYVNGGGNDLLHAALPALKRKWKKLSKKENDFRGGAETYGYQDAESIKNNMLYISDRWMAAFRIKWIIDGIEGGKI